MNKVKKYLGVLWLVLAPLIIYALVEASVRHTIGKPISAIKKTATEINNPVIWIIIIAIFTPIAIGLMIFGWYALKGQYGNLPESSNELES